MRDELSDYYYRLVAVLEAQLRDEGLSLRRLLVWLVEPLERLRLLANACDACAPQNLQGGALCASLARLATHGDDPRPRLGRRSARQNIRTGPRRDPKVGLLREIAAGSGGRVLRPRDQ